MANYQILKADIDEKIYENAQQKITGENLNSILNAMVATLGAEYQFAGVATIDTNPETSDAKIFYIANGKGTYTNFGGINVTEDDVVILYYDTSWHKVATGIASNEKLSELESEIDFSSYITDTISKICSKIGYINIPFVNGSYYDKDGNIKVISTYSCAIFGLPKGFSVDLVNFINDSIVPSYLIKKKNSTITAYYNSTSSVNKVSLLAEEDELIFINCDSLLASKSITIKADKEEEIIGLLGDVEKNSKVINNLLYIEGSKDSVLYEFINGGFYNANSEFKVNGNYSCVSFYALKGAEIIFNTRIWDNIPMYIIRTKDNLSPAYTDKTDPQSISFVADEDCEVFVNCEKTFTKKLAKQVTIREKYINSKFDSLNHGLNPESVVGQYEDGYWYAPNGDKRANSAYSCLRIDAYKNDRVKIVVRNWDLSTVPAYIIKKGDSYEPIMASSEFIDITFIVDDDCEIYVNSVTAYSKKKVFIDNKLSIEFQKKELNMFLGKKYASLGDSITARNQYQQIIDAYLGTTHVNFGWSGEAIGSFVFHKTNSVWDRLLDANDFNGCAFITICGYANNLWHKLGNTSDEYIRIDTNDVSLYDSVESYMNTIVAQSIVSQVKSVLDYLTRICPTIPIIYIGQLQMSRTNEGDSSVNFNKVYGWGYTTRQISDTIKEVANYWSIPYIDMERNGQVNINNYTTYYDVPDTTHPNFKEMINGDYPNSGMKRMAMLIINSIKKVG